ncbi:hypothetical protein CBR_g8553 [Chara braunii]|uniref:Integrase catalytic domain-containing protein n=1 Tax=Chara braunii TaxID=69332 RepID=A0A388JRY0_CHABU|nr:hypothetical protein CBR_g8553 [Chara braunii]|eukprot:GBG60530.1 hypothetical protein CBR_g8553 [Chara braunii]
MPFRNQLASEANINMHNFPSFSKKALDLEAKIGHGQTRTTDGRKKSLPPNWKAKGRITFVDNDRSTIDNFQEGAGSEAGSVEASGGGVVATVAQKGGEVPPTTFGQATIVLLYKKGSIEEVRKWRPISLLSATYKLYAKVLANRIILVNVLLVRQIMERAQDFQPPLATLFLDFEKAYGRVKWPFLLQGMRCRGFGEGFVKAIQGVLGMAVARVHVNGFLSSPLRVTRSVRQGCPLSPALYILYVEHLHEMIRGDDRILGFELPGGGQVKSNAFADDTFQHAMNRIFHDYLDKFVIVYLDDILIFSRTVEEQVAHLDNVLCLLRRHKFKINGEKSNLLQRFWWPAMMRDAKLYVETCQVCQRDKPRTHAPLGLLKPLPIPERPGESLSMDFMDTLVTSKSGMRHIFVIVDRFSKYARLVAMPETAKTEHVIKLFKENWVRDFGLPKSIVSGRDVRFTSELWKATAAEQGTQLQMTSGNHPEANGQAEQLNRAAQHLLRHYIKPNQVDWDEKLALIASLEGLTWRAWDTITKLPYNVLNERFSTSDSIADSLADIIRTRLLTSKTSLQDEATPIDVDMGREDSDMEDEGEVEREVDNKISPGGDDAGPPTKSESSAGEYGLSSSAASEDSRDSDTDSSKTQAAVD